MKNEIDNQTKDKLNISLAGVMNDLNSEVDPSTHIGGMLRVLSTVPELSYSAMIGLRFVEAQRLIESMYKANPEAVAEFARDDLGLIDTLEARDEVLAELSNHELIEQVIVNAEDHVRGLNRNVLPEPEVLRKLAKALRDHVSEYDRADLARIITGGEIW
jgi:hypothetical protein